MGTAFSFDDLQRVLALVATVVAILAGSVTLLLNLRKLAPGWHRKAASWTLAAIPLLLAVGGVAALFTRNALASQILFLLLFGIQVLAFAAPREPVTRSAVVWFGLACTCFCLLETLGFLSSIAAVLEAHTTVLEGQTNVLKSMMATFEKLAN